MNNSMNLRSKFRFWSLTNRNKLLFLWTNILRNWSNNFFALPLFNNMCCPAGSSGDDKNRSKEVP